MRTTEEFFQIIKGITTDLKEKDQFENRLKGFGEYVSAFATVYQKQLICIQFNHALKPKDDLALTPENLGAKIAELAPAISARNSFAPNKLYAFLEDTLGNIMDVQELIHAYKVQNAVIDQPDYQQRIETGLGLIKADIKTLNSPLGSELPRFATIVAHMAPSERADVKDAILSVLYKATDPVHILVPQVLHQAIDQQFTHCPDTKKYEVFIKAVTLRLPMTHPLRRLDTTIMAANGPGKPRIPNIFLQGFSSILIHLEPHEGLYNKASSNDDCKYNDDDEKQTGRGTNLSRHEVAIANDSFCNHLKVLLTPLGEATVEHDRSVGARLEFERLFRPNKSSAQKVLSALDYMIEHPEKKHYPKPQKAVAGTGR